MKINNYELTNEAIGILDFIQKYQTHFNDKERVKEDRQKLEQGIKSPIQISPFGGSKYEFSGKRNSKTSYDKEVGKLIKAGILILNSDKSVVINTEFHDEIFNTDFSKILPKAKNMSKTGNDILIFLSNLYYEKLFDENKGYFDIKELRAEVNSRDSVSSFIKYELFTRDFIEFKYKETDNYNNFYSGERAIRKDIGRSVLAGSIRITKKGIEYLENNKPIAPFIYTKDIKPKNVFKEYDELVEICNKHSIDFETVLFNKNGEYQIILRNNGSIIDYHNFLKEFRASNIDFLPINFIN